MPYSSEELTVWCHECVGVDQQRINDLLIKFWPDFELAKEDRREKLENLGREKRKAWLLCPPPPRNPDRDPDPLVGVLADMDLSELHEFPREQLARYKRETWLEFPPPPLE